jgi:crossover junction endodeoxyribonuclease RusA
MTSKPQTITIELPLPPSANRYWRTDRGIVHLSGEAREYKREVAKRAAELQIEPLEGLVVVAIDVYRARRAGDLDNSIKCALDSLEGCAFGNDNQVVEIHARRFDDPRRPRLEVTVTAAAGAQLQLHRPRLATR